MGLAPYGEGSKVGLDYGIALTREDAADGITKLVEVNAECSLCGAEEDHVGGTGDGGILGQLLYIEADDMRQGSKGLTEFVDIGIVGNIDEGDAGGDDPAIGSEIGDVAQGFHRLHGDDDIGGATGDEVAGDRVAGDAQVGLNIASALTHAVHLGLLDIEILVHGCLADDSGDGKDALSSHTAEYDINFHYSIYH